LSQGSAITKSLRIQRYHRHILHSSSCCKDLYTLPSSLTPCRRATQKCVIALTCLVDGSRMSTFSYTKSCTSVCQLVWLTYRFKFIVRSRQDACVSSYNHKTATKRPLIQIHSVFLQLQSWLCVGMFCKRTIFCESYMWIHVMMCFV
jgi:hypothetical protein